MAFLDVAAGKAATTHAADPAAAAIVEALRAARLPFSGGEAVEARLFEALRNSSQSRATRHLFFASATPREFRGSRSMSICDRLHLPACWVPARWAAASRSTS